jgi:quercetin dioxygenase-like cupin family protein
MTGSRPGATSTRARSLAPASGSLGPFGGSERAWSWPPGGGPPPHIHRYEDETFYILEGECRLLLADEWITAGVGDFINVPRGTVHRFHNQGTETMRMILTFTPAGIEDFFQETLQPTLDPTADVPDNFDAVAARYATAAPRYGMQFVTE